ncbi:hypothetical protein FHU36_005791 [Nonomuraea muscovyensis]|uniref:Uncharacterized protein n=1 Tax=Nonomuraea muscovyensis TaxID=1124761 RepID=A0A7X0C7V7_9ACTN|nr:hypothetical protein [Nonomuraea muscovyensis]MBB6349246.1 hypothetical protein [Nonomuraea muscovyensis]
MAASIETGPPLGRPAGIARSVRARRTPSAAATRAARWRLMTLLSGRARPVS